MHKAFRESAKQIFGDCCSYSKLSLKDCWEEYTVIELQVKGLPCPLWFCYSSTASVYSPHRHWLFIEAPPLPHLFAPVKGKERQALDEYTFDLSEAPLLLLLSFFHHPPCPLCWGAVRVLKAWSVRSAPVSTWPRLQALSSSRPMLQKSSSSPRRTSPPPKV